MLTAAVTGIPSMPMFSVFCGWPSNNKKCCLLHNSFQSCVASGGRSSRSIDATLRITPCDQMERRDFGAVGMYHSIEVVDFFVSVHRTLSEHKKLGCERIHCATWKKKDLCDQSETKIKIALLPLPSVQMKQQRKIFPSICQTNQSTYCRSIFIACWSFSLVDII